MKSNYLKGLILDYRAIRNGWIDVCRRTLPREVIAQKTQQKLDELAEQIRRIDPTGETSARMYQQ